jgi:hypothetical protein
MALDPAIEERVGEALRYWGGFDFEAASHGLTVSLSGDQVLDFAAALDAAAEWLAWQKDFPRRTLMDDRIAQMMRVLQVLYDLGVSLPDSLKVLRAFYVTDEETHEPD